MILSKGLLIIEVRLTGRWLETSSGSHFLYIGQIVSKRQSVGTNAYVREFINTNFAKGSAKKKLASQRTACKWHPGQLLLWYQG